MPVDQSTLSRDLAELGIRKVGGRYAVAIAARVEANGIDYASVVRDFVPCGPNLIVISTQVGQAQPVAVTIDEAGDPSIVGTVAGDDTIFVATKTRKTQAVALRRLEQWFGAHREE
jgi:transcriptional regulator of arginine metabolism